MVAPTGSGKTLSAFLWSIDRLLTEMEADPGRPIIVIRRQPDPAVGGIETTSMSS